MSFRLAQPRVPGQSRRSTRNPAKAKLGWEAATSLEQLCAMMVEANLRRNAAGVSF